MECKSVSISMVSKGLNNRRFPRNKADIYAVVRYGTVVQPARIKDISAGGLRLEGLGGLRQGTPIVIELITGRQFEGNVAWSEAHKMGVRFKIVLAASDPVLKSKYF